MDAETKAKVVAEWKTDPLMLNALRKELAHGSTPEHIQHHQVLAIKFGLQAGLPWMFDACGPEQMLGALENHEFTQEITDLLEELDDAG